METTQEEQLEIEAHNQIIINFTKDELMTSIEESLISVENINAGLLQIATTVNASEAIMIACLIRLKSELEAVLLWLENQDEKKDEKVKKKKLNEKSKAKSDMDEEL